MGHTLCARMTYGLNFSIVPLAVSLSLLIAVETLVFAYRAEARANTEATTCFGVCTGSRVSYPAIFNCTGSYSASARRNRELSAGTDITPRNLFVLLSLSFSSKTYVMQKGNRRRFSRAVGRNRELSCVESLRDRGSRATTINRLSEAGEVRRQNDRITESVRAARYSPYPLISRNSRLSSVREPRK